ncbi:hypothetical protein [uncultured Weissella sp.]|uniref:hypothetical protein n=1 Tax=uncultured Weissella sp. TaxID=253243 RepID=UPI00258D4FC4|nr:hypothetical protein [uncultured Weissella sp.]
MIKMNNISINEVTIQNNTQKVLSTLLRNKHKSGSKTNIRIKTIYTKQNVLKMATQLFNALNNRGFYTPVSDSDEICAEPRAQFNSNDEFKSFCIKLFTDDLRRNSENIYDKLKLSKNVCQGCHVRQTNALDHFFDKKDAYELAIFPDNLIPICTNCNSKKGTKSFVYPYFLILQNANWLECKVNADQTFAFSISKQAAKTSFEKTILMDLHNQYNYLKTFDTYIINGQAIVTDNISNIKILKYKCGFKKDDAKKLIEAKNEDTKQVFLKTTEFYKIAILDGIVKNFDNIWNKVTNT